MRAVVFKGKNSVTVEDVPDPRIEAPNAAVAKVGLKPALDRAAQ